MISFSKEQIYIVTGASSGLGESTAIMLNELGASVVAIARNSERLEKMKNKCRYPENMFLEIKDLTENIDDLPKYVKTLKEKYGKFSGLVCCAGCSKLTPLQALEIENIRSIFDINYFSQIFLTKGFLDRRCNVGKGASVVAIASIGAMTCDPSMVSYSGSKGALISSMKVISKEVINQGIRVNTISPSLIDTPMADDMAKEYALGNYPFGLGEPNDVAGMIVYLLSDKAKFISGQNYVIDSGGVL